MKLFFLYFFLFTTVSHAIRFDYPFFFALTQDENNPPQETNNFIGPGSVGHATVSSDGTEPKILLPTETHPTELRKTYKGPTDQLDVKLFQLVNRHGQAHRLRPTRISYRCRHHHLHKLLRFPGRVGPAREVDFIKRRNGGVFLRDRHVASREFLEGVDQFVVPMQNYRLRQRDHDDDVRVEIKGERVDGHHHGHHHHHHHGHRADDVEHEKKGDGILNKIQKFLGYFF